MNVSLRAQMRVRHVRQLRVKALLTFCALGGLRHLTLAGASVSFKSHSVTLTAFCVLLQGYLIPSTSTSETCIPS